ncbi:SDR family oxidoreductase [Lonsdalea quercina]|uniref:SDR family oxidoreductase n=1 Tax=Lonsdalea quercina TaxID=71657 RepID=UPI003975D38F
MEKHPWLIFGGASGVGRALVALGLQESRAITALVRNAEQAQALRECGVTVVEGDALDARSVQTACETAGPQARIVSTLGSAEADYAGNRLIIDSAERYSIGHMVLVTSIGCGESWHLLSPKAREIFGHAVREKSLAESWLKTSRLNGCILRPGGLKSGSGTGLSIRVQEEALGLIHREDVARQIQQVIDDDAAYGKTYFLIDPTLTPSTQL